MSTHTFEPGPLINGGGMPWGKIQPFVCGCGKSEPGPPNKVRCNECSRLHGNELSRKYQARKRAEEARGK